MTITSTELFRTRARSSSRAQLVYEIEGIAAAWNPATAYSGGEFVTRVDGTGELRFYTAYGASTNKDPLTQTPAYWSEVDEDTHAYGTLTNTAPTSYNNLYRVDRSVEKVDVHTWEAIATYGRFDVKPRVVGDTVKSFRIGAVSQHITQSLSTRGNYVASGTAPNYKGAINVSEDGVLGVDVFAREHRFSRSRYFASITAAYEALLADLAFTTNAATFEGFAIGEVLFLGAHGTQRGDSDWELIYEFGRIPNSSQITVGDITIGNGSAVVKYGWDYLWCRYERVEDATAGQLVMRPSSAHIEQVYASSSWTNIFNSAYTGA